MKKLNLILAGALLLGGISFASPVIKQAQKAPVTKPATKPVAKPAAKPAEKPAVKPVTGRKDGGVKKGAPVKNAAK